MTAAALARWLLGALVAATVAGVGGTLWLLAGATVPDALLPLAAVAGGATVWCRRASAAVPGAPAPRWLTLAVIALLLAAGALLAHGTLATPARHWDGAVAWELKARVLAAAPTLAQPYFRDPQVYCHSRDYPLLQPLLAALLLRWHVPGGVLFPLAYLVLAAAIGAAARAGGVDGRRTILCVAAAAVTPMWLSPTSGGFDSGYGDALLAAWLGCAAWGVATANAPALGCSLVLTILQKPEGLPYAGLAVAALWLHGDARLLRSATLATAAGGALLVALQHDLRTCGGASRLPAAGAVAFGGAGLVLGLDRWLRRREAGRRARLAALLGGLPLAALLLATAAGGEHGLLGSHLADPMRPWQRLDRLPRIATAIADWAVGRGAFGLTFVVPVVVTVALWHTRTAARAPALRTWLLLAVPLWCTPFLTSPLDELDRHLRATLPRVLLHWTGVVWLWSALQPVWQPGPALGSRPANS
jgi:hypothetical protein